MKGLEKRIQATLEANASSVWENLIRLLDVDPEAFYLLVSDGIGKNASATIKDLAHLAGEVRSVIQETYEIERTESGDRIVTASGTSIAIPDGLVPQVAHFLQTVDGKSKTGKAGKDYVGTAISEAEMRFKLGEDSSWKQERAVIQDRLQSLPLVIRISEEEKNHLAHQPAYITYGLLNCARKTVLAPTSVFKGLGRGEECPTDLKTGWAFCGKPRQAFDNEGRSFPAPEGMVYMVYANERGFVFDWDWVTEGEPGCPVDRQIRFGNPYPLKQDAVLELPNGMQPGRFDATEACYSRMGDCIFCYMTEEVSHATRINADLTVFNALSGGDYTGFKIKNVQRILAADETIEMTDAPGLTVSVDKVLLATLKRHPTGNVQVYSVLIHALYKRASDPPQVRIPVESELVET